MVEGIDGAVGTLTYQNNVFSNMRQGINVGVNVATLKVFNNTWDHIVEEAIIFNDSRSGADEIINNIFYDVGGGGDSYACIPSGSPTIESNDFFMPGGSGYSRRIATVVELVRNRMRPPLGDWARSHTGLR